MPDIRVERLIGDDTLYIYDRYGGGHVSIPPEQEEHVLERLKELVE